MQSVLRGGDDARLPLASERVCQLRGIAGRIGRVRSVSSSGQRTGPRGQPRNRGTGGCAKETAA